MASIFFTERLLALPNSGQRPMHAHAVVLDTVMHWFSDGQKSRDRLHFCQQTSQIEPLSQSRVCANSQRRTIFKRYQSIRAILGMLGSAREYLSDYKLGSKFIFCAVVRL
jgi:hypothetical protein